MKDERRKMNKPKGALALCFGDGNLFILLFVESETLG